MKKILFALLVMMLSTILFANTATGSEFNGQVTVLTQYMDGYNNVHLSWEDNSQNGEYFAYIITSGNSDNEENYLVKGYTADTNFSIYRNITAPTVPTYYSVYKVSFNENYELADIIPNDDGVNQNRAALTWSQIKDLLKRKSNNIWKIQRNNIPTDLK